MDLRHIKGFVCESGGATSHTAILARAVGIPAVVGCKGVCGAIREGDTLMLDGATGEVIPSPAPWEMETFLARKAKLDADNLLLKAYRNRETISQDGIKVHLCANAGSLAECEAAMKNGCEGIGLFRSEFLYMERSQLPDEDTQVQAYKNVLHQAGNLPVTIRTLDAGGDKGIPALGIPKEDNPFLGYRAIRVCLDRPGLFKTQLRALYRASVAGNLRIMFPMISGMEELLSAKALVAEVKRELDREGVAYSLDVKLGIMIEVPSAAIMADDLAKEADFFSLGTNDLTQYTLAVDRGNEKITKLYTPMHPAVLRLVHNTIQAAHQNGIPCCMCGEAAGDPDFIPLLLGLGLEDFSMSPASILGARRQISTLSVSQCQRVAAHALSATTVQEIKALRKEFTKSGESKEL